MHESARRLPSLDNLKGFDAAARHLSFTRAATELFLTQSAISRQVQALEEQLGVRLFKRETRKLSLTPEGEILHRAVAEMLRRFADVCAGIRAARQRPRVTVSSTVGLAALWLVPRLSAFQEAEPGLDVLISADNRMVDLEREGIDLALRYASPDAPPENSTFLFDEVVFPVATPALAQSLQGGLRAENLEGVTLLAFDDRGNRMPWLSWEVWLRGIGLAQAQPKAVLYFNQYDQLIRAAEDGRGIALGRGALVARLIAEGRLLAVGDGKQRVARAYFLVRAAGASRPEVERFAQWLLGEARKTEQEATVPADTAAI